MNWKKKLTTCTVLVTLTALVIHAINKIIYFIATLDSLLDKTDGHYYEWRFGNIFYTKQGSGKPIILIHDLNTMSSGYEWHKIVNHLSATNTVYVIDLLGCGRSSRPDITYTNYLYVQLLTDFIKNIVGEKVDIVSSGLSSSFVLMACNNDDTIIDKIVMVNPHSLTALNKAPTKNSKIIKMLINTPLIGTLIYNIIFRKQNIESLLKREYFYNSDNVKENMTDIYYESAHTSKSSSKFLFSSIRGRDMNASIISSLEKINNSIFIINGDSHIEEMTIAEKQYTHHLPSIETVHIDKTIMVPHLEKAEEFMNQLDLFLEINE